MRDVSGADFAAHSHFYLFRGLKPPASIHRPFGPETTFGIHSKFHIAKGGVALTLAAALQDRAR